MRYSKPNPSQKKCPGALDQFILKSNCIKTTSSGLSYELGVNSEKKVNGTGILIKMDKAHFAL